MPWVRQVPNAAGSVNLFTKHRHWIRAVQDSAAAATQKYTKLDRSVHVRPPVTRILLPVIVTAITSRFSGVLCWLTRGATCGCLQLLWVLVTVINPALRLGWGFLFASQWSDTAVYGISLSGIMQHHKSQIVPFNRLAGKKDCHHESLCDFGK